MRKLLDQIESLVYLNTSRKYVNLVVCALILTSLAVALDHYSVPEVATVSVIVIIGFPALFVVSKIGSLVFPPVQVKPYPYGVFELKKSYQRNFAWALVVACLFFVGPIMTHKILTEPPFRIEAEDRGLIPAPTDTIIIETPEGDSMVVLPPVPHFTDPLEPIQVQPPDPATVGIPEPVPDESDTPTVVLAAQIEIASYLDSIRGIGYVPMTPELVLRDFRIVHGAALPGKTIDIMVTIANLGGKVRNVAGLLTSLDHNPRVRVHSNTERYRFGIMKQNDSENNRRNPFKVTIPTDFPPGDSLRFQLRLTGDWKRDAGYLKDRYFSLLASPEIPPDSIQFAIRMKEVYREYWVDPVRYLRDKHFTGDVCDRGAVYFDAARSRATIRCGGITYEIKFDFSERTFVGWNKGVDLLENLSRILKECYCASFPSSEYCQ